MTRSLSARSRSISHLISSTCGYAGTTRYLPCLGGSRVSKLSSCKYAVKQRTRIEIEGGKELGIVSSGRQNGGIGIAKRHRQARLQSPADESSATAALLQILA